MTANLPQAPSKENVSTTISSGINDSTGTITVADASNLTFPSYIVIDRVDSAGTVKSTSLWEYVKVTNISGSDLTITRAQGGSTAQSHSAGAVVEAVVTAAHFTDWYATLNPEHTSTGGHVITGTMTVAGMNLISVATIAKAGIGVLNAITHLNASGASITGAFGTTNDPLFLKNTAISSIASIAVGNIRSGLDIASGASVTGIPQLWRQGGSATTFASGGTNPFYEGRVAMQVGTLSTPTAATTYTVTFPQSYTEIPIVFTQQDSTSTDSNGIVRNVSKTTFDIVHGSTTANKVTYWMSVGRV